MSIEIEEIMRSGAIISPEIKRRSTIKTKSKDAGVQCEDKETLILKN